MGSEDKKTSSLSTKKVVPKKFSSSIRGQQQYSVEEQKILMDHILDSERLKVVDWEVWKPAFWKTWFKYSTGILPSRSQSYIYFCLFFPLSC